MLWDLSNLLPASKFRDITTKDWFPSCPTLFLNLRNARKPPVLGQLDAVPEENHSMAEDSADSLWESFQSSIDPISFSPCPQNLAVGFAVPRICIGNIRKPLKPRTKMSPVIQNDPNIANSISWYYSWSMLIHPSRWFRAEPSEDPGACVARCVFLERLQPGIGRWVSAKNGVVSGSMSGPTRGFSMQDSDLMVKSLWKKKYIYIYTHVYTYVYIYI